MSNPVSTTDARLSEMPAKLLWPLFQGIGCIYAFLADHYWFTIFEGSAVKPHDPGECVTQILQREELDVNMKHVIRTMRRIRNALHHRKHADGSSVYLRDVVALQEHILKYLAETDFDTIHELLAKVIATIEKALYYHAHPECTACPACGQTLVTDVPPAVVEVVPPVQDLDTFEDYKQRYGMDPLKGRRIVVKLASKKLKGWYSGYFRSWNGTMVYVDLEKVGRIQVRIQTSFYLE
jgi:hypothetical protein